ALLFPIDWPEPFGLVMIEAMREGTPVVAWRRGSVAEVVDDGVTGFAVESIDEAVHALGLALALDRKSIRTRFEERFTVSRMAENYLTAYDHLLNGVDIVDSNVRSSAHVAIKSVPDPLIASA
ncbi:MAG TPA: glycosyltransferase, partial [Bradyrhizobium sp.]|nr:glycosyltransferase [Bradyrhizobium sp.]